MTKNDLYRIKRGLGKTISLAVYGCKNCGKTRTMLFSVLDKSGNKVYACNDCKNLYKLFVKKR